MFISGTHIPTGDQADTRKGIHSSIHPLDKGMCWARRGKQGARWVTLCPQGAYSQVGETDSNQIITQAYVIICRKSKGYERMQQRVTENFPEETTFEPDLKDAPQFSVGGAWDGRGFLGKGTST